MNLLRVAIASLLLPAGAQVQAADVSRMAPVVRTPAPAQGMAPNVAKTPAPPGPVPIPYPNIVRGAPTVNDRAPVTTVIKRDQVPIKLHTGNAAGTLKEAAKIRGGQQAGTVVRVPAVQMQGGSVKAGGLRLNPLDDPSPPKSDLSGDDAQLTQRKLQERTSRESSNAQTISNTMKKKADTEKSVIQNIK